MLKISTILLLATLSFSVHTIPQGQPGTPSTSASSSASPAQTTASSGTAASAPAVNNDKVANADSNAQIWSTPIFRPLGSSAPTPYSSAPSTPPVTPSQSAPAPNTPLGNVLTRESNPYTAKNGDVYLGRLDADDAQSLVGMIKKVQDDYKSAPASYNKNSIRPLYANNDVINGAYALWNNEKKQDFCKINKGTILFCTPKNCMSDPSGPPKDTVMVNAPRANINKRSCTYTVARCVDPDFYEKTVQDVLDTLNKFKWDAPYFSPEPCYAPAAVAEEAWREWSKLKLNGEEGLKTKDGQICGKQTSSTDSVEGAYSAAFGTPDCVAKPRGPKCRVAYVQCV